MVTVFAVLDRPLAVALELRPKLARRDLSALVTDRFPLERFDDALALLEGSKECGKFMVAVDGTLA